MTASDAHTEQKGRPSHYDHETRQWLDDATGEPVPTEPGAASLYGDAHTEQKGTDDA